MNSNERQFYDWRGAVKINAKTIPPEGMLIRVIGLRRNKEYYVDRSHWVGDRFERCTVKQFRGGEERYEMDPTSCTYCKAGNISKVFVTMYCEADGKPAVLRMKYHELKALETLMAQFVKSGFTEKINKDVFIKTADKQSTKGPHTYKELIFSLPVEPTPKRQGFIPKSEQAPTDNKFRLTPAEYEFFLGNKAEEGEWVNPKEFVKAVVSVAEEDNFKLDEARITEIAGKCLIKDGNRYIFILPDGK